MIMGGMMANEAHDLVAALRFHRHPLTRQAANRISQLEDALAAAESFIDGWKFERIDDDCELEAQAALGVVRAALHGKPDDWHGQPNPFTTPLDDPRMQKMIDEAATVLERK